MIVKICGMREPDNIRELMVLKPDYVGLIFYPHSRRFVGDLHEDALTSISSPAKKTGVFVNETMDAMADKVVQYDLDAVQLHGDESVEFCSSFKQVLSTRLIEKQVEVVKAFGISEEFDFNLLAGYEDIVDYFLFDTKTREHGGSGQTFDWSLLENYLGTKPYFLSGGLSSENINGLKEIKDERFYGIDLNSKFEVKAGEKDIDKLRVFLNALEAPNN